MVKKENKDLIIINKKEITSFVTEGGKLVFKSSAEDDLLKLLNAIDYLKDQLELVKKSIAEAGQSITKDFKGVVGSKLRVLYKKSGDRFSYDRLNPPADFLKEITFHKVDPEKIDAFIKENKKLPDGITENVREPKLIIIKKNEEAKILP